MKTLHQRIADKLEQAEPAVRLELLKIPLDNIDRWLAKGHTAPHRLEQWRVILLQSQESMEGFAELIRILRDSSDSNLRLKDFAPFAGVLTREERQQTLPECAFNF